MNRGELDITSPFGIYKGAHRQSNVFKIIEAISKKMKTGNLRSRAQRKIFNRHIKRNDEDYMKIVKAAERFYKWYFTRIKELRYMTKREQIIYKSMYINMGGNAIKILQEIIKVKKDGKFGPISTRALQKFKMNKNSDLRLSLLEGARKYYNSLARNNPDRFLRFLKGWLARIRRLRLINKIEK